MSEREAALTAGALKTHFRYFSPWLVVFVVAWALALGLFAADPAGLVARHWMFVPIGFVGSLIGNISAVGGGIVFIPCMILLFHLPPVVALKIALATQSFGMSSGAIGWLQKRAVPLNALAIAVPGLILGSSISTFIIHPSALLVKALFGPVSMALGGLTLFLTARPGATRARRDIPRQARAPLFIVAVIGGLITGWVAIGEGEVAAALLMLAYGLDVAAAIGLGVVLLAINSIYLTLAHQFALGGVPWDIVAFTGLGGVFGARFAPWVSRHFAPKTLKLTFAAIAIGDGALFVGQYLLLG